jgi:hypothetical protein
MRKAFLEFTLRIAACTLLMSQAVSASANELNAAIVPGSWTSSQVIGLEVYNDKRMGIGQIKDIAVDDNGRIVAYILAVGGVLEFGRHYVAIAPSAVKIHFSENNKSWHAVVNASLDQVMKMDRFDPSEHLIEKACLNILRWR